jgi:serine protease AprX
VGDLPLGATATFAPAAVTGSGSSQLTVSTSALTLPGSYRLIVTGTTGVKVRTTSMTLAVSLPSVVPPGVLPIPSSGFTLAVRSPTGGVTKAGVPVSYAVTLTPVGTYSEPVVLSITGLPDGATAVFTPPVSPAPGASLLTVQTQLSTPTGRYFLTITGSSGSIVETATTVLQIT